MKRSLILLALCMAALAVVASCGINSDPVNYNQSTKTSSAGALTAGFSGCYTGAFVNGLSNIPNFESESGKKLAVVMWYVSFTTEFPTDECTQLYAGSRLPCITWEPWNSVIIDPAYSLQNIINGTYDAYITRFADAAKALDKPLLLRFAHEMNSNWYPWAGSLNGGDGTGPAQYILAWKHVHDIFTARGAGNVLWVWNVNNTSIPSDAWNDADNYYPGDAYVDWIGIDGYNTDPSSGQTFDGIFYNAYNALKTKHSSKPMMIGEFACGPGTAEAAWITDAFQKLQSDYPGIKIFNWFNIVKETDWTITSSAGTVAAYARAVAASYFVDTVPLQ